MDKGSITRKEKETKQAIPLMMVKVILESLCLSVITDGSECVDKEKGNEKTTKNITGLVIEWKNEDNTKSLELKEIKNTNNNGGMKWKRRAREKGGEGQNTIIWGWGKTRKGEQEMEVEYCTSPKKNS